MTDERGEKERRRAARKQLGEYHERELLALLERVRDGSRGSTPMSSTPSNSTS